MKSVLLVLAAGFVSLVVLLVFELVKEMVVTEARTRLERLPLAILRLARRRLPVSHRDSVYDEEWLPELLFITRESEGLPITRVVRGTNFALGLLVSARSVARRLGSVRTEREPEPDPSGWALNVPRSSRLIFLLRIPSPGAGPNLSSRHATSREGINAQSVSVLVTTAPGRA